MSNFVIMGVFTIFIILVVYFGLRIRREDISDEVLGYLADEVWVEDYYYEDCDECGDCDGDCIWGEEEDG